MTPPAQNRRPLGALPHLAVVITADHHRLDHHLSEPIHLHCQPQYLHSRGYIRLLALVGLPCWGLPVSQLIATHMLAAAPWGGAEWLTRMPGRIHSHLISSLRDMPCSRLQDTTDSSLPKDSALQPESGNTDAVKLLTAKISQLNAENSQLIHYMNSYC